jgi:hypothetical protein
LPDEELGDAKVFATFLSQSKSLPRNYRKRVQVPYHWPPFTFGRVVQQSAITGS